MKSILHGPRFRTLVIGSELSNTSATTKRTQQFAQTFHTNAIRRGDELEIANGSQNQKPDSNDGQDDILTKNTDRPRHPWKPTSKEGIRDLKALAELLDQSVWDQRGQPPTLNRQRQKTSPDKEIPWSPVEIRSKRRRRFQMKRDPTSYEVERISRNPWAVMLAEPVRRDVAARICFPRSLMMSLGYLERPGSDEIYVVPDTLSDLTAFKECLESGNTRKAFSNYTTSPQRYGSRIVPYKLLLDEISDNVMVWNHATGEAKSKPSAVAKRLVHVGHFSQIGKEETFRNASKAYWATMEAQGKLDDYSFRKPEPMPALNRASWDPSMVQRIPDIMGQRVLLAFGHVLKKYLAVSENQQAEKIIHVGLPCDGTKLTGLFKCRESPVTRTLWNDMDDIERPGAIDSREENPHAPTNQPPPIAVQPCNIQSSQSPDSVDIDDFHEGLPGSFLIHLGPQSEIAAISSTRDWRETGSSKYVLPMLQIGNHGLPIFSLSSMLSASLSPIAEDLVSKYKISRDSNQLANETSGGQLLLVKPEASESQFLIAELWQLWRFIGGTDCFQALEQSLKNETELTCDISQKPLNDTGRQRILRSQGVYQGVSPAVLDHLLDLLDFDLEQKR